MLYIFGRLLNQSDDGFYCRAVKEVLLGIVIRRRGDNDEVSVLVCGCAVCGGMEIELAGSFFGFAHELLDVVVLDGGLEVVDLLDLLRNDVDRGDIVVLGEKDSQRETDVAGAGDSDVVGLQGVGLCGVCCG